MHRQACGQPRPRAHGLLPRFAGRHLPTGAGVLGPRCTLPAPRAIGVGVTLFHLGKIGVGEHRIQTPVGVVKIGVEDKNTVTIENVESYRKHKDLTVEVEGKMVRGDVAWGGNWFFLVPEHGEQFYTDAGRSTSASFPHQATISRVTPRRNTSGANGGCDARFTTLPR